MHDYKNLIYLGTGAQPPINELTMLADQLWLVDASAAVIEQLQIRVNELPNINVIQALVSTEKRPGTFYEYSLAWANAPTPLDEATQRLYPGLRPLQNQQQPTSDINQLVHECLELDASGANTQAENLLIIDLGNQAQPLLEALHESNQLLAFRTVMVVPPQRNATALDAPPSLRGPLVSSSTIPAGLPKYSQVFERHPLAQQNQRLQRELQHVQQLLTERKQQRDEQFKLLNDCQSVLEQRTQERDTMANEVAQARQLLEQTLPQLAECTQQRDELKQQLEAVNRTKNENQQQQQQQQKQEQTYRQQLIDKELLKAEAQLDLIKDILIRDKAF